MSKVELPYGKDRIEVDIPGASTLRSRVDELSAAHGKGAAPSGADIVKQALAEPIDSAPLRELARDKKSAVIIISDHTRPVPSKDILPAMLSELREGRPDIKITLLVATGFHRPTTEDELRAKLGDAIYENENIIIHDCRDEAANVNIGLLPSGAPLVVDRAAVETDLLLAEGFIEPHFFAGYSGGRKSVLPGICDKVTVLGNHCSAFIDSPFARAGVLEGNPLHQDMVAAAKMIKLAFIVNVILDEDQHIAAAFAGEALAAHAEGCEFLAQYCRVKAAPADIVITTNGGYPLDQNIYQSVKGLTAAEASAKEGAVLIICAKCNDGHGGEGFFNALKDCESPSELYKSIMATPQEATIADQWESQILARIMAKHRVIFVSQADMRPVIEAMKLYYAADIDQALAMAREWKGQDASVTVIPNGVSVVID